MYTISGCSTSLGSRRPARTLGQYGDIDYSDLARFLWGKISHIGLIPTGDLDIGIPDVNLDVLIPNPVEDLIVTILIQETEKKIKEATDIDDEIKLSNISKYFADSIVNIFRDWAKDQIGTSTAAAIERTTLLEFITSEDVDDAGDPLITVGLLDFPGTLYLFTCEGGPSGGALRKTFVDKLKNVIHSNLYNWIIDATGYEPPEAETFAQGMNRFMEELKAKAIELASSTKIVDVNVTFGELQRPMQLFALQKITEYGFSYPPDLQNAISNSMNILLAEVRNAYARQQQEETNPPQKLIAREVIRESARAAGTAVGLPSWIIEANRRAQAELAIPIVPIAIGGIALLLLLKK